MPDVRVAIVRAPLSRRVATIAAPSFRDFLGDTIAEEIRTACYNDEGRPRFEYPRIQLKVVESMVVLFGIAEGASLLERLWPRLAKAELGGGEFRVKSVQFEVNAESIEVVSEPLEYRFLTPWLGLNARNFRAYVGSRSQGFRTDERSRILTGNCIGMLKSLGLRFEDWIEAKGRKLTSIKTTVNGGGEVGFLGGFYLNLRLPDYLGLGRHVGQGFGTLMGVSKEGKR